MNRHKHLSSTICTKCHGSLYVPQTFVGPSLVQGRLYCESCAARLRRRTEVAIIGAGALTLSGIAAGAILAATDAATLGPGAWLLPFIAAAEYGLVFGGAIRWMKRRNAAAHLELGVAQSQ